jgi:formylglycine-generating enzyme required for sulfatase activity
MRSTPVLFIDAIHVRIRDGKVANRPIYTAPNYCRRYRPGARMAQAVDTSTFHLGFRCIARPDS